MQSSGTLGRIKTPPLPLQEDEHGVLRVQGTRIPLETVLFAFQQGETPEQIVQDFPALRLEDVYTILAYYLSNKDILNAYLRRVKQEIVENEPLFVSPHEKRSLRRRLLRRRRQQTDQIKLTEE